MINRIFQLRPRRYRFSRSLFSYAVWVCHRFSIVIARWDAPEIIVTDKQGSYDVTLRKLASDGEHRTRKRLNNGIENPHGPPRRQESLQGRFKPVRQECLALHA